jgi:peptidoglycan lytic transglycosylase G
VTRRAEVFPSRREELAARRAELRQQASRRRRRLAAAVLAVLLLVGGVVGGGYLLYQEFFGVADYEGDGGATVVVQVADGATGAQIGGALQRADVVKSVEAFTRAAASEPRIRAVQPGYYLMRNQMSGDAAVTRLLDPATRVGQLEIRGGVQLDDTSNPDGSTVPGVLSLISNATCAELGGQKQCVSVDDLRSTMSDADLTELGVPSWARDDVAKAEPKRRLEGLLVPGVYDVKPGAPALDVLQGLLSASVTRLESDGLVSGAREIGYTPYKVLIVSSLVEKEGITADMPKVARVLYNRLGAGQRLQLDSTVNYPLDLQALRTNANDRAKPGPYNSYAVAGLPPTPIAAPGKAAIEAALAPADGPWQYFVRCRPDGASCFAETLEEHNQNVAEAVANGAF